MLGEKEKLLAFWGGGGRKKRYTLPGEENNNNGWRKLALLGVRMNWKSQ